MPLAPVAHLRSRHLDIPPHKNSLASRYLVGLKVWFTRRPLLGNSVNKDQLTSSACNSDTHERLRFANLNIWQKVLI